MRHITRRATPVQAKAATVSLEVIAVSALLILAALFAMPAHAMTQHSADLYSRANDMGHGFRLSGAVSTDDYTQNQLEHVTNNSTYMVSGTLTGPAAFAPKSNVNLYMTAGAGVAVEERNFVTTSANTDLAPSFHVGMGLKYNF